MNACCQSEAEKHLKRHRDVASCDQCGALLLAYGNDVDFDRTVAELDAHDVSYQTMSSGKLKIVAKAKTS